MAENKTTKPKGRGRPKGEPNKGTEKHSLLEYARMSGKTPAEFLIDVMNGKVKEINGYTFTGQDRYQAAKDAAPYCHPKLRSQEIKGEIIPGVLTIKNA